jgi:hypothetical protein
MSDIRLRAAERQFRISGTFEDYCHYMAELRRSAQLPVITPTSGSVQGWFPAAVHALAPYILTDVPEHWQGGAGAPTLSLDALKTEKIDVIRRITKDRQETAALCLPPRGILSHILIVIQSYLPPFNPLRCTCGGESRGHSPDCEVNVGTGSIVEGYYQAMTEWCNETYGYSLLDEFLAGGPEAVYQTLAEGEFELPELFTRIFNQRLHWNYQIYLGWQPLDEKRAVFSFRLSDFGPMPNGLNPGIARSMISLEISTDNHCKLSWEVKESALENPGWGQRDQMSYSLAQRISHIPMLIEEYPVWV